jgi:hypothetical protein
MSAAYIVHGVKLVCSAAFDGIHTVLFRFLFRDA